MSETPTPAGPNSGEPKPDRGQRTSSASAVTCKRCGQPLAGAYYEVNGEVLCDGCRQQVEKSPEAKPGPGGYLRASCCGLLVGVAAAALCYGLALEFEVLRDVRWVADHQGGVINHPNPIRGVWISILIGSMVGVAVKAGGNGRGGESYQILAMALTQFAIALTYIPLGLDALGAIFGAGAATHGLDSGRPDSHHPTSVVITVVVLAVCLAITLVLPIILNHNSPVGIIVLGVGLFVAWFINRPAPMVIKGPFQIGPTS